MLINTEIIDVTSLKDNWKYSCHPIVSPHIGRWCYLVAMMCITPCASLDFCVREKSCTNNNNNNKKTTLRSVNSLRVPQSVQLPRLHVPMALDFANTSASKSNISLYFVYLQTQWFCFWWRPQQHPIPPATATTHKVNPFS